ncbi:hypothetical protein E0500_007055 [Streptomyces sp. KM273126]|uniref:hypothetical protein n=1 Tax=Streptomyces sp. KM273126 TaxID=2545247 RepID=UPI00103E9FDC|nr:hypothetical protein [Streptomyces sp. KM273126]MBA2807203.1 hypothetical protein [Streptomyces sp. KM273126]
MESPANTRSTTTRLLPWTGAGGKPCCLLTDDNGGGYLTRFADNIESVQLGMGNELLGQAQELISDPKVTPTELRYLSARLTESLRDVLRVAESRGARLPMPEDGDDDDNSNRAALNNDERTP